MKTGPDALRTAETSPGAQKTRKPDRTPPVPLKVSPGAQNMKTVHDALGTAENDYGCAKHENWTRRPL
jgi:hypothetical protein